MNSRNILKDEETKQVKSKTILDKLKTDYFLERIFNIMCKKKSLGIMKYNKKLQKKMKINVNDYKAYSQKYSSIEIELKVVEKKYNYDKFINIPEEKKEYYHIYFNDSNNEIKRNYLMKNEKVKKIKIIIDYQVQSFKYLFFDGHCISSIYFKKFSRNNITDMSWMFGWCSSLKELNLTNFNTDNVTDMNHMLFKCSSLEKVTIPNFNSTKVTNMSSMFSWCTSLKELNIPNFNTNNVTDMSMMFLQCPDELKKKIKEQNKNLEI